MKTPQRNFVVEIKSGRRRLTRPLNSIWGNTDIKSLVLEAEGAHLSARPGQTLVVEDENARVDYPQPMPKAETARRPDDDQQIAAQVFREPVSEPQSGGSSISDDAAKKHARSISVPGKKRRKRIPKIAMQAPMEPWTAGSKLQNGNGDSDVRFLELAALMDENVRLKRLLSVKLSEENQHLIAMLGRFD
jgi:hypothetical protein